VGISIDSSFSQKAWAESIGGLSFPLLADFWPHGEVAKKYGVLRDGGFSERALFIVDKQGIIRYIDVHELREQPDEEVLFEELRKLQ
jgi:alkyl hydroperoxide reductase subunit AhpC